MNVRFSTGQVAVGTLISVMTSLAGCRPTQTEVPPATCVVSVRPRPSKALAKGVGQGPTEEAARANAWNAVCAEMPEADRGSCRNPAVFAPSSVVVWKPIGDGKVWEVTLMMHHAAADTTAEVTGGTSDEACARAELEACKGAGAAEDCVKSGQYERVANKR